MADLQEFKCPCCGGSIEFNSETQKMQCPYCDTEFDVDALKGYEDESKIDTPDEMEWETSAGTQWQEGETDGLRVYVCKSFGIWQLPLRFFQSAVTAVHAEKSALVEC